MKRIGITAGTLYGNRGAEAMVSTCIEQVKIRYPDASLHILSYYPEDDRAERDKMHGSADQSRVYVHSLTPLKLLSSWLPASFFALLMPKGRNTGLDRDGLGPLKLIGGLDAVFDVAGVSFIDNRLKFIPFNVLTLFPFLLNNVKVFKLSQAMGPITNIFNLIAARLILPKLSLLVARGQQTFSFVSTSPIKDLRLTNHPDVSFVLDQSSVTPYQDRAEKAIAVMPSALVAKNDPQYVSKMVDMMRKLHDAGYKLTLIAHSWRSNTEKSRNNDLVVARAIQSRLPSGVDVLGEGLSARELRDVTSRYRCVLTSRFHGLIAALTTLTPVIVIGWSHKYQEVLDDFSFDRSNCIDFKNFDVNSVFKKIEHTVDNGPILSQKIESKLPGIKQKTEEQFLVAFNVIDEANG